jgi:tetratricopeptide (TPR) repeat protein
MKMMSRLSRMITYKQKANNTLMKQLVMLAIAVSISLSAFSQNKNVNKANVAFTKGEYAEAAALIEPATKDEKTSTKGRTWYIRGQIYGSIATSDDAAIRAIDADALTKAYESYSKVLELENEGSNYSGLAQINLDQLRADVMNAGVAAFQADDSESAYKSFQDYAKITPTDTTGYIYSAMMAQQMEDYDAVVSNYEECFALDYYPKSALNTVIFYSMNQLDKPDQALKYIKIAQEKYPEDADFQKSAVDFYIKQDKMDEAITEMQHAIELEPDNARLYSNLGMLYDSQEKFELAVEQYKKALEIDPNDRFSLINMAVFYIGQGDKINHDLTELTMAEYRKVGEKMEEQAKVEWTKAIPFLETVLETDDTDELALQNLHAVYYKLRDVPNAQKIEKRRRDLGYIIE